MQADHTLASKMRGATTVRGHFARLIRRLADALRVIGCAPGTRFPMRTRETTVLALMIAGIGGCATPNLQPFADQTARLADAVSGEQRQVAQKFQQVIELYGEACARAKRGGASQRNCELERLRKENEKAFAESRRVIDSLLEKVVAYAAALAELAKEGETGEAAAQSLVGTVKQFAAVTGMGGLVISETVGKALEKISQAVTRVQAQKSLLEATSAARGAVIALADGVVAIHREADAKIVAGVYSDEYDLLLTLAGEDLVGLFQDARLNGEAVYRRLRQRGPALAELRGCKPDVTGSKADECSGLEGDLRNAGEIGRLLERLRPDYDAYVAKRAAAMQWRIQRQENFKLIIDAVGTWKSEHERVIQALERCGALRALRCVDFNPDSLKTLINRINDIQMEKGK